MTKFFTAFLLVGLFANLVMAQNSKDLIDNEEWQVNGMAVGYRIINFRKQEVKDKGEMDRYEVACFVYNKGDCEVGIRFTGNERDTDNTNFKLATFNCLNATGARLTAKGTELLPEPHYFNHRWTEKNAEGKTVERSQSILVGYFLTRGRQRESSIVIIVPPGEKPEIRASVNF